jgi:hypothetical protein
MFGCPSYSADGKLFAFLTNGGVVVTRITKRDREAIAKAFPTQPFKAGEREIARWLQIDVENPDKLTRVISLVRKSYEAVLQT